MRKSVSILIFFLLCGVVGLYGKKISHIIAEDPVTKTVRFSVFAGTDYSTLIYKKSKAKILLSIYKFNGNQQVLVWEGIVDQGSIKNYPSLINPIIKEVSIHNVFDRSETLAAYYKVLYDYKGSKMFYEDGISLSAGSGFDSLEIKI